MDDLQLDQFKNYDLTQSINKIRNNIKTKTESKNKTKIESDKKKIQKEFAQLSSKNSKILLAMTLSVVTIFSIIVAINVNKSNNTNNYYENESSSQIQQYENALDKELEKKVAVAAEEKEKNKFVLDVYKPGNELEIIQTYQTSLIDGDFSLYQKTVGFDYAVGNYEFEDKSDAYNLNTALSIREMKNMDNHLVRVVDDKNISHYLVVKDEQLYYMEFPINRKIDYALDYNETDVYKSVEDSFALLKVDDFDIKNCIDVYKSYSFDKYYVNAASDEGRVKQIENIIANTDGDISDRFWPFLFEYYYTLGRDYDKAIYAARSTIYESDLEERISNMRVAFSWYCKGEVLNAIEILSLYPDNYKYANEMLIMDKESYLKQNNEQILTMMGSPYMEQIDYILDNYYINNSVETAEINTMQTDLASPQEVGTSISISANASSDDVTYKFEVKSITSDIWNVLENANENSAIWEPELAGEYVLNVSIYDEKGKFLDYMSVGFSIIEKAEGDQAEEENQVEEENQEDQEDQEAEAQQNKIYEAAWGIADNILYTDQIIAVKGAKFHKEPSTESIVFGTIKKGATFYVEDIYVDDEGEIWCYSGVYNENNVIIYGWCNYNNFQK